MFTLTPPMGWNSWNTFAENIDEKLIRDTADVIVEKGLDKLGYNYVIIDDCWSEKVRDKNGRLVADAKKISLGNKSAFRLHPFKRIEIRHVFLLGHADLRGLPVQLRIRIH